jgi:hypothetical protein
MTTITLPHLPKSKTGRTDAKVWEFAAAHPNAVLCLMYRKSWRHTDKLTHIYFLVKDGQPTRLPAHKTITEAGHGAALPRYTLDLERSTVWRDYTENDVYTRLLTFARVNESYLNDADWTKLREKCRLAALRLNRWLKNARIAELRRKGLLS